MGEKNSLQLPVEAIISRLSQKKNLFFKIKF